MYENYNIEVNMTQVATQNALLGFTGNLGNKT